MDRVIYLSLLMLKAFSFHNNPNLFTGACQSAGKAVMASADDERCKEYFEVALTLKISN